MPRQNAQGIADVTDGDAQLPKHMTMTPILEENDDEFNRQQTGDGSIARIEAYD